MCAAGDILPPAPAPKSVTRHLHAFASFALAATTFAAATAPQALCRRQSARRSYRVRLALYQRAGELYAQNRAKRRGYPPSRSRAPPIQGAPACAGFAQVHKLERLEWVALLTEMAGILAFL